MAFQTHDSTKYIREYIIKERIGVGSYGMIYKVISKNSKQLYVLKQIPFLSSESKSEIDEVKNEALILSQLNSRFVVRYYDSFEENNSLNIVMELCEGGDLCSYLETMHKSSKKLSEDQIWKFFIQLSLGMDYIHKRKILHRDLKTMNIFLTKDLDIKIGDLGVAKRLLNTANAYTFIGTPFYLSPEICEEKPYNEKSDVWALGCILYEMMTYKHPFNASNQAALFIKILNGTYEPICGKYSKELKKMIDMLLDKDHIKRPSIRQVIEMPSFLSKAKALGMIDSVIDALSFFNSKGDGTKVKMIKIAAVHVNKKKEKIIKSGSRKKKRRENSIGGEGEGGGGSRSQHSDANNSQSHSHNNSNSNSKGVIKLPIKKKLSLNGIDHHHVQLNKDTPKQKRPSIPIGNNSNSNLQQQQVQIQVQQQNNHNNNNKEPQQKNNDQQHFNHNPIQLKKPMIRILNCENNIMRKLHQISNDYMKQKEEENNLLLSNSQLNKDKENKSIKDTKNKHKDKDKSLKDSNSNLDKKVNKCLPKEKQITPSVIPNHNKNKEETKQSIHVKLRNSDIKLNLRKKKVIHLNSFNNQSGNGSSSNRANQSGSSSANFSKDHHQNHNHNLPSQYPPINKLKSQEQSCDIYQFAKELDKKALKIQTIKKSKTNNNKMSHVPLCDIKTDEHSFKVEEAEQSIPSNNTSIEYMTNHNSLSNWNNNAYLGNNNAPLSEHNNNTYEEEEDGGEEEEEEVETVLIIKNNDVIEREKSEMKIEYDQRKQSLEVYKNKCSFYKNEIMKYSDMIDCDYFFDLYKELENNENIDEKTNKIFEYIHKMIPDKAPEFAKIYYNYIIYEMKNRENEKAIKTNEPLIQ